MELLEVKGPEVGLRIRFNQGSKFHSLPHFSERDERDERDGASRSPGEGQP